MNEKNDVSDHTRGPWVVSQHEDIGSVVVRDSKDRILADFEAGNEHLPAQDQLTKQEILANAHLFAASPLLMETVEVLAEALTMMHEAQVRARGGSQKHREEDLDCPQCGAISKATDALNKAKGLS